MNSEYSTTPPAMPCGRCYLTPDALGTTRLITSQSLTSVAFHDFLPFGEEIPSGLDGRSSLYGGSDQVMEKFTGKERDAETGLDFFNVRYMSSAQGRFTCPDPFGVAIVAERNR